MAEYLARDLTMLQGNQSRYNQLSPFVPREGTSFRHQLPCNLETFLRLTAILRVMFPKANIAASPLVNSIHVQGQVMAIYSGANVLPCPPLPAARAWRHKAQWRCFPPAPSPVPLCEPF